MVPNMITVMVISLTVNCDDIFHENDDDDDDENNADDDDNDSYDEKSSCVHSSILQFKKSSTLCTFNAMQCNSIQFNSIG